MPQYDRYHENVKNALLKDGWTITDDPFPIAFENIRLYADLGAEKIIDTTGHTRKIVIEVKVFSGLSFMTDLEKAVGQYTIYRTFLSRTFPERILYLAIPDQIHRSFFQNLAIQAIIADHHIKLLVFKPIQEEITQWKD
jgi:glucose-6-phosphate 1-dehydrogenase